MKFVNILFMITILLNLIFITLLVILYTLSNLKITLKEFCILKNCLHPFPFGRNRERERGGRGEGIEIKSPIIYLVCCKHLSLYVRITAHIQLQKNISLTHIHIQGENNINTTTQWTFLEGIYTNRFWTNQIWKDFNNF